MTIDLRPALVMLLLVCAAHAEDDLQNHGHDPSFQIPSGVVNCPEPAGPRITEAEQERDSYHHIEHGNHCWVEGRCRLPSAFSYDDKTAETTKRRLQWISIHMPGWKQNTTLWLTIWQRWVLVQGCLAPGYTLTPFMTALHGVPNVERSINKTTAHPERGVPYAVFRKDVVAKP